MSLLLFLCTINFIVVLSIKDWLINSIESFPNVTLKKGTINDLETYILSNGLISRTFIVSPNFGTIGYDSFLNGNGNSKSSIIRSLSPEGIIGINDINYNIGGFNFYNTSITNTQSPNTAYISTEWIKSSNLYTNNTSTFIFNNNITITSMYKPYEWIPGIHHSPKYISWPPKGLAIQIEFIPTKNINTLPSYITDNIKVYIRYEMYQGMPIISKSIIIDSINPIITSNVTITNLIVETLKVNVPYSPGSNQDAINACLPYTNNILWPYMNMISYSGGLYFQTDEAHPASNSEPTVGNSVKWSNDVNMNNIWGSYQPNVDIGYYPSDQQTHWAVTLEPTLPGTYNGTLKSFRALQIVLNIDKDLGNMERMGLARRRMLQYLSPTTTENPIFAATVDSTSNSSLRSFIDQCNETGFELLIFSFGSGFNMEKTDQNTLNFYKDIIEYGNSRGIEIGGYDLIMEDRSYGNGEYQVVGANGKNENDLCFASGWLDIITSDFDAYINIGMRNIITDGPYGGQACYSTKHKYHQNSNDSVFRQEYLQNQFFVNIKNKGVYIHQPDNYYFYGGSKSAMGYNENQYSLPRWLDLSVSRMGMYDDTYIHTVTEGWMFLPLTAYHSSNPDCYFEPLSANIKEYDFALGQYFGFGVMAMMRGNELYDNDDVKNVVIKWTSFYNKHRDILISDIIHLRRCDMQYFDAILHANPLISEQGLAVIYNPTNSSINTNYTFSLYYTGLKNTVMVSNNDQSYKQYTLQNLFDVTLSLELQPLSINYFVFKNTSD